LCFFWIPPSIPIRAYHSIGYQTVNCGNLLFPGAFIFSYIISVFSHEPVPLYLEHLLLPIWCQGFPILLGCPSPRFPHHFWFRLAIHEVRWVITARKVLQPIVLGVRSKGLVEFGEGKVRGSINRGFLIYFDYNLARQAPSSQDIRSVELIGFS
jgi:hypothetical protein